MSPLLLCRYSGQVHAADGVKGMRGAGSCCGAVRRDADGAGTCCAATHGDADGAGRGQRPERPIYRPQDDFRGADGKFSGQPICAPHGRKKGGQRKTAARPFGIKRKSEVPIPRINPNRTNAREPGEDDRRARGLNSREHGPGHGKDQCFTLPSASGLCLYLKTSAKTTPTTRA